MSVVNQVVPLADCIPHPRNYNGHKEDQVAELRSSLRRFGQVRSIVVQHRDDMLGFLIAAGHGIVLAARAEGYTHLRADVIPADWNEVKVLAYLAADNELAKRGTPDEVQLAALVADVAAADAELARLAAGAEERLARLIAQARGAEEALDAEPQIDRAEELRRKWRVEVGQLWALGDHRLICGDCTNPGVVQRLLQDDRPGIMVTDPPYGVDYDPTWRDDVGGEIGEGKTVMRGRVDNDDRADWSEAWKLFPGDVAYVWHAGIYAGDVALQLAQSRFVIRAQIVWVKPHFVMSRGAYHWQHEPCWYAVRKGARSNWIGDRRQSTAWQIKGMNPFGSNGEEKVGHGTQKPIECMERPIRNHQYPIVYEPFCGSGTTLLASEHQGRKCLAAEINPAYVAVTLQRYADATRHMPRLVEDARTQA